MTESRHSRGWRILLALVMVVVVAIGAFFWYVSDYYHAGNVALACVADEGGNADGVVVRTLPGGELAFVPDKPAAGFIFYPGGKVQPEAYAPLMERCAERGILSVIVRPPFNLAVFAPNAADGIREQFPTVDRWAIGGHSLGGVLSTSYLADHEDSFTAAVLLASYPTADLTNYEGEVVVIRGANDKVISTDRYEASRDLLPADSIELVIEGGNHAQFGDYGEQAGDGKAAVSADEQQEETVQAIRDALAA